MQGVAGACVTSKCGTGQDVCMSYSFESIKASGCYKSSDCTALKDSLKGHLDLKVSMRQPVHDMSRSF